MLRYYHNICLEVLNRTNLSRWRICIQSSTARVHRSQWMRNVCNTHHARQDQTVVRKPPENRPVGYRDRSEDNIKINLQAVAKVWTGLTTGQITPSSEQSNEQISDSIIRNSFDQVKNYCQKNKNCADNIH